MIWIVILVILLVLFCAILLLPVEFKIDTRIPIVAIQWAGIGQAILIYTEEDWWLKIGLPFFHKQWPLMQLILSDKKKKKKVKTVEIKKRKKRMSVLKFLNLLKTFRVIKLEVAISNSDYIANARWYFLNFLPHIRQHVLVNFEEENYLILVIRNNAWRIAYAFIKY